MNKSLLSSLSLLNEWFTIVEYTSALASIGFNDPHCSRSSVIFKRGTTMYFLTRLRSYIQSHLNHSHVSRPRVLGGSIFTYTWGYMRTRKSEGFTRGCISVRKEFQIWACLKSLENFSLRARCFALYKLNLSSWYIDLITYSSIFLPLLFCFQCLLIDEVSFNSSLSESSLSRFFCVKYPARRLRSYLQSHLNQSYSIVPLNSGGSIFHKERVVLCDIWESWERQSPILKNVHWIKFLILETPFPIFYEPCR